MLPMFLIAAAVGALPSYNLDRSCRIDTDVAADGESAYHICVKDERAAKDRLAKEWNSYPASVRRACASDQNQDLDASYVELMTCLEIEEWKNHLDDIGGRLTNGSPALGGSPFTPSQIGHFTASHPLGGTPGAHLP